jgi:hypothetical protein
VGCDIALSVEWLTTLGPITKDFLELYMSFQKDGHSYTLKALKACSLEIVISHCMEKLLKRGHYGIIAQLHAIHVFEDSSSPIHSNLQLVLDKHQQVFELPQEYHPHVVNLYCMRFHLVIFITLMEICCWYSWSIGPTWGIHLHGAPSLHCI